MLDRFYDFVCSVGNEAVLSPEQVSYFRGAFVLSFVTASCIVFLSPLFRWLFSRLRSLFISIREGLSK